MIDTRLDAGLPTDSRVLFGDFPYVALDFELEAVDGFPLPIFAGSSFRGLLGHALRDIACLRRDEDGRCADPQTCAYSYLFETAADGAHLPNQSGDDAARPFVLEPPMGFRSLARGDRFKLGLRLFGRGVEHARLFVRCLEAMGVRGLGQDGARFTVRRVWSRTPFGESFDVYDARYGRGKWTCEPAPFLLREVAEQASPLRAIRAIELHFLTPARLQHQGQVQDEPEFHVVMRALLRRLEGLLVRHGNRSLSVDFRAAVQEAGQCGISSSALRTVEWARWSERQQKRMTMAGIVGPIRYIGPIGQFMPLLAAGTVVHVGKATTFGMGRYDLRAVIGPL